MITEAGEKYDGGQNNIYLNVPLDVSNKNSPVPVCAVKVLQVLVSLEKYTGIPYRIPNNKRLN